MTGDRMDRKKFILTLGAFGVGGCMCAAAGSMRAAFGDSRPAQPASPTPAIPPAEPAPSSMPGAKTPARAVKRMEFVDGWVQRFFQVVDQNLDEPTRRKLMTANGKACFAAYDTSGKRRPTPASPEEISAWVARTGKERGYSMEGNTISFEYVGSAETGQDSPENICLCPTVEAQTPKTISPTYCHCSVGYVKEMHERRFGRPVEVKLVDAVLLGGKRCKFQITLA